MTQLQNIEELFQTVYSPLDEPTILHLNKQCLGDLNNVVVGLEKQCFGLMCMDDTDKIIYRLFYANGEAELQGDIIELTIDNPYRDRLVFYFSQFLEHNYKGLDTINTYNTFQKQTRTLLEQIGYLTISPTEFVKYGDPNPLIMAKDIKGIIKIPLIDKREFYKSFFGNKDIKQLKRGEEFVYIMLNPRTDLVKIGRSKDPNYREKTLQGQEPEIILVSFWKAPSAIEKKLHIEFSEKRQRGEWFDLTFKDLKKINELMKAYE
jgi:Meiotically up-regulated gene 113